MDPIVHDIPDYIRMQAHLLGDLADLYRKQVAGGPDATDDLLELMKQVESLTIDICMKVQGYQERAASRMAAQAVADAEALRPTGAYDQGMIDASLDIPYPQGMPACWTAQEADDYIAGYCQYFGDTRTELRQRFGLPTGADRRPARPPTA